MSHLIQSVGELAALRDWLGFILERGQSQGGYIEVPACLLSIQYDRALWDAFVLFRDHYVTATGAVGEIGWERATRVYTNRNDRRSKPSYLKRLRDYPDQSTKSSTLGINQIETIVQDLIKKPGYSCLSFVILRPADLRDKFRPGSVPCPIAGDFKFRRRQLSLSVMFRTSDALSVGYADIYYLRRLQREVLDQATQLSERKSFAEATLGDLTLFFARTYIPKRPTIRNGKVVDGVALARRLLSKIETFIKDYSVLIDRNTK